MLQGLLHITFGEQLFNAFDPDYREQVLNAMLIFAAECQIGNDYWQVLKQVKAALPALPEVKTDSSLDSALFTIYGECLDYQSVDAVLVSIQGFGYQVNWTDATIQAAARLLWQAGKARANQFIALYHPYFEAALSENLYAPEFAFVKACELANLPLDSWAKDWPEQVENATGYYLPVLVASLAKVA